MVRDILISSYYIELQTILFTICFSSWVQFLLVILFLLLGSLLLNKNLKLNKNIFFFYFVKTFFLYINLNLSWLRCGHLMYERDNVMNLAIFPKFKYIPICLSILTCSFMFLLVFVHVRQRPL